MDREQLEKTKFEFNGTEYFYDIEVGFGRLKQIEDFQFEWLFLYEKGNPTGTLMTMLLEQRKAIDDSKMTKIVDINTNMLATISLLDNKERQHPALKICACFLNIKGEGKGSMTSQQLNSKVFDFEMESNKSDTIYRSDFFLNLAKSTLPNFQTIWNLTQSEFSELKKGN